MPAAMAALLCNKTMIVQGKISSNTRGRKGGLTRWWSSPTAPVSSRISGNGEGVQRWSFVRFPRSKRERDVRREGEGKEKGDDIGEQRGGLVHLVVRRGCCRAGGAEEAGASRLRGDEPSGSSPTRDRSRRRVAGAGDGWIEEGIRSCTRWLGFDPEEGGGWSVDGVGRR